MARFGFALAAACALLPAAVVRVEPSVPDVAPLAAPRLTPEPTTIESHALIWLYDRLRPVATTARRSEEHTSELQSLRHLVCRLLLEKKNKSFDKRQVRAA